MSLVHVWVDENDVDREWVLKVDDQMSNFMCLVIFWTTVLRCLKSYFRFVTVDSARCQYRSFPSLTPPRVVLFSFKSLFFTVKEVYSFLVTFLKPCYFLVLQRCRCFLEYSRDHYLGLVLLLSLYCLFLKSHTKHSFELLQFFWQLLVTLL